MPIIKVGTNRVAADEPEPGDTHVHVVWFGPGDDGKHHKVFHGPPEPVENYEAAVAWAVEMAQQMVWPLYVVPLRSPDAANAHADAYLAEVDLLSTRLTDRQRGELRRVAVAIAAEAMRDCDDPHLRAAAYAVLLKLKVVRP